MPTNPSPKEKLASLNKPEPDDKEKPEPKPDENPETPTPVIDTREDERVVTEAEMMEYVREADAIEDNKVYNKDAFFSQHGATSKYPRLDERASRRNEHWTSAEGLALEILTRANVAWWHPQLVKPLAEAIKAHVTAHDDNSKKDDVK